MRRFTIDTNVLWDAVDGRSPNHSAAAALLKLHGLSCEMRVTTRLDADVPDGPMRALIGSIPMLSSKQQLGAPVRVGFTRIGSNDVIVDHATDQLAISLRQVVFPGACKTSKKEANRLSDVDHLIAHVRSGNDCFVTSDGAILDKKIQLAADYSIKVVSPQEAIALATSADSN